MVQDYGDITTDNEVWRPLRFDDVKPDIILRIRQVVDKIPDLPLSVGKIIEMTKDDESNLSEIVGLISSDPGLVSNILKVVNSSYYGLRNKTDNLHLAIVLLGYDEVRRIAVQSFFRRMIEDSQAHRRYTKQLWDHSYLVSVCAESFCKKDDTQRRGVYLTMGLLHDIGKFVLYHIAQMMKKKGITPAYPDGIPEKQFLMAKEETLYHINHPLVGYMLAEKWNLSERFKTVLQFHHYPSFYGMNEIPREFLEETTTISIADILVNRYLKNENELPSPHPHFFDLIGLKPPIESLLTEERVKLLDNARTYITHLR